MAPQISVCQTSALTERPNNTDVQPRSRPAKRKPGWLPCTKRQSILKNNLIVKARTPGCSTLCAQWLQKISYLLFLIVSGNMGHFFLTNVWHYSEYLLEFWLFLNNNFEFVCVFALPGKAVRIEIRTAPANISTNRSSAGARSPERPRGEASG